MRMMRVIWLLFLLARAHAHTSDGDEGNHHKGQCIEKEKEALLSYKLVADPGNLLSWATNSSNQDCCSWEEITCDNQTNHVVAIEYFGHYGDAVGGEIGCSLAELHYLNHLSLTSNNFIRIPKCIGSFKHLTYLDLSNNPISGTVPLEIGNLTKLQYLDLTSSSSNHSIFVDNFAWFSRLSSLRTFVLASANFTKEGLQSFRLPPSLFQLELSNCLLPKVDLSFLSHKNYSSNFLNSLQISYSSIHPSAITLFLNSSNNLSKLIIIQNIIDGSFPDSFREMRTLSDIDLSYNTVENGVPKSLGDLANLQTLDLAANNLSGNFHDVLENLTGSTKNSLEVLNLDFNQLRGFILDDVENTFPSMRELSLWQNKLEGTFPGRLSRFPSLETLFLGDNQLTGPLPDLSSMPNLTSFIAFDNNFNSTSTESIGELSYLETIDVSSNSLVGVISEVNLRCPKLEHLSFSNNSALRLKFNSNWVPPFQLQSIDLVSCKLGPKFPTWLKTQSQLYSLDISNSDISDVIPNWFSNITSELIVLDMSFNFFYNILPHFQLKDDDTIVDLSFNQFRGSIPSSLSNVTYLFLSNNNFTSCSSFLCEAKDARTSFFHISNNQLFGSLPDCWGNFNSLMFLKLDHNNLSGEIPTSIGILKYIEFLQLGSNNLSGPLPSTLKNCTYLSALDFGWNNLEGTIPSWIGERFSSLVFLNLKSNKFVGNIPLNLCNLSQVQILDLSSNGLSGVIPLCFANFTSMVNDSSTESTDISIVRRFPPMGRYQTLSSHIIWKGVDYEYSSILGLLRLIDLSSNKLAGSIPDELTLLVELTQLNLSRNELSGNIPKMIGSLTKLESLDLSHNKLSGHIPISLAKLSLLDHLDLSNNRLRGQIPTSTQLQSFNASSYAMNHGLCGLPLTSSCHENGTLSDGSLASAHDKEDGTWFDLSWFYKGIGAGFTIGFCGVCINFVMINYYWRNSFFLFMHRLRNILSNGLRFGQI